MEFHGIWGHNEIGFTLTSMKAFMKQLLMEESKLLSRTVVRPLAIVFAPPWSPVVEPLLKNNCNYLNFLHQQSEGFFEFFCIGYFRAEDEYFPMVAPGGKFDQFLFDSEVYSNCIKELEANTNWHYTGGAEIILLNAIMKPEEDRLFLDLQNVLIMNLEKAVAAGVIANISALFQELLNLISDKSDTHPVQIISDKLGLRRVGEGLYELVMQLIPWNKLGRFDKGLAFMTHNIARAPSS